MNEWIIIAVVFFIMLIPIRMWSVYRRKYLDYKERWESMEGYLRFQEKIFSETENN